MTTARTGPGPAAAVLFLLCAPTRPFAPVVPRPAISSRPARSYAAEAVELHGACRGTWLALKARRTLSPLRQPGLRPGPELRPEMLFAAATHTAKAGTSIIGTVLHPIFVLVGYVLAFFYGLIPNYAVAIALLTIAVMIVVFPLTRASARSMMRMQLLAPEMKRIQTRYKPKPGMHRVERQELRQKMNEEVMALYRENGVNPTGGCLPMFLQFPILIVLYDVVRGLSKTAKILDSAGEDGRHQGRRRRTFPRPVGCPRPGRGQGPDARLRYQSRRLRAHAPASPRKRDPVRVAGAHSRRAPVRVHLAGDDPQPCRRLCQSADAADAEVHALDLPGALHRPAGRCGRLLHSLQLVPGRPAGVDVQTRPDDRESHQRAHGTQESRGRRG